MLDADRAAGGDARTLRDVWPNLSLVVHGGVAFAEQERALVDVVRVPDATT